MRTQKKFAVVAPDGFIYPSAVFQTLFEASHHLRFNAQTFLPGSTVRPITVALMEEEIEEACKALNKTIANENHR